MELQLFCGQPRTAVVDIQLSDLKGMFGSKAFASWKKATEHEMKLLTMIIDRLDGVGKRIDGLGKALSRRK